MYPPNSGLPPLELHAQRQVGKRVVSGRLVGDDIDRDATAKQLGQDERAVALEPHAQWDLRALGLQHAVDGGVEIAGPLVEVAVVHAALEAARVDVDNEHDAVVHRHACRCRSSCPPSSGRTS